MISLKLVIYYLHEGVFLGPFERLVLPIGKRAVLTDSRVRLFGEHDPIPIDTPFAYRINLDPENPRFDRVTDDPAGLEYPCFSIGWGADWWTNPRFIDQAAYAISFDVEVGGLGLDYALWDNAARAEGHRVRLAGYENNPIRIEPGPFSLVIGATGPVPDTPIVPLPEPVVSPPTLPTLADGPTEGMDVWAAWRDGRANGLETAARYFDRTMPLTSGLIRLLK